MLENDTKATNNDVKVTSNDKLVIAWSLRAISTKIFLFSHILSQFAP